MGLALLGSKFGEKRVKSANEPEKVQAKKDFGQKLGFKTELSNLIKNNTIYYNLLL